VLRQHLFTGDILMRKRKKYQEKEEIRHPDSPEGLVNTAANNWRSQSVLLAFTDQPKQE
jgi:phage terminase small subunit